MKKHNAVCVHCDAPLKCVDACEAGVISSDPYATDAGTPFDFLVYTDLVKAHQLSPPPHEGNDAAWEKMAKLHQKWCECRLS